MSEHKKVYGIGAEFSSPAALYSAAEKIRDAGFKKWDVYSPFPIHGMDKAMGMGKSWLSAITFIGGLSGFISAIILEFYPSSFEYPMVVHGKPVNFMTVPAFFPIMFELTILCSAFATIFGLLVLTQLPKWYHPMFNWERFGRATDNGFFIGIEARDPKFSESKTRQFLEEIGGMHVTLVHD
jgi:hypothetical protein